MYKKTSLIVSVTIMLSFSAGICSAGTVWTENFEGFSLGDLPAQDSTWTSAADAALTSSSVDVVTGKKFKIYAAAPGYVGGPCKYAYKNLSSYGITGNTVTLSFEMMHAFVAPMWHGKTAGMGFYSTGKGWMFFLEMYDGDGTAFINGNPITFPPGNTISIMNLRSILKMTR